MSDVDEEALAERAQDVLVAERIMGIPVFQSIGPDPEWFEEHTARHVPHYSTDIAAAFRVLGKMAGWRIEYPAKMDGLGSARPLYRVRVWAKNPTDYREWNGAGLPAVICTAALEAVGA